MLLHPEGAARQQGRLDAGRGQRRHAADTRGEGPGAQAGRRECRATGERGGAAQCMAILRKRERLEVLLIDGDIM